MFIYLHYAYSFIQTFRVRKTLHSGKGEIHYSCDFELIDFTYWSSCTDSAPQPDLIKTTVIWIWQLEIEYTK